LIKGNKLIKGEEESGWFLAYFGALKHCANGIPTGVAKKCSILNKQFSIFKDKKAGFLCETSCFFVNPLWNSCTLRSLKVYTKLHKWNIVAIYYGFAD